MKVKDLLRFVNYNTYIEFYEKDCLSIKPERFYCGGTFTGDNVNDFLLERDIQGVNVRNNHLVILLYKESEVK